MSRELLLTGRVVAYVRHLTAEEMDREEWMGQPPVALVFDNGAVVYAGMESEDRLDTAPGHLLAQYEGQMFNLRAEAERAVSRHLANNVLRRTQVAAWTIAALMALTAVGSVVMGLTVGHFAWTAVGPGVIGLVLGAALCLVLASLVAASRIATSDPKNTLDRLDGKRDLQEPRRRREHELAS